MAVTTATSEIVAGQTVFHALAEKWDSLEVQDGRVRISNFVDAVDDFLVVFKALGSAFFSDLVKMDMRRNMEVR